MSPTHLIRSSFLHCLDDPATAGNNAVEFIADGVCRVQDGFIVAFGDSKTIAPNEGERVLDYRGKLIVPGFVDTHIHYPQVDVIASYGSQLLDWLEKYTFPCESRFHDSALAAETAAFFLDELLNNGTTTALVFGTSHKESVDAFFVEAAKRHLRMIAGKVMMDRNAPDELIDNAHSSYIDSKALIEQWHGKDRLGYAVTPRFAPTSTREQLDDASIAHCAMSNLFIGSGLFNYSKAVKKNVRVGLGTDIGGGDSFSLLRACNETYKVQQMQNTSVSPPSLLYLATLGGARALDLDQHIGNFTLGKEADMVVLDEQATPLLARKSALNAGWEERLFTLLMLGDDRVVFDTLVLGASAVLNIDSKNPREPS